jgi:Zn finger protein HypA/HybF involved in hydrogenase expression
MAMQECEYECRKCKKYFHNGRHRPSECENCGSDKLDITMSILDHGEMERDEPEYDD